MWHCNFPRLVLPFFSLGSSEGENEWGTQQAFVWYRGSSAHWVEWAAAAPFERTHGSSGGQGKACAHIHLSSSSSSPYCCFWLISQIKTQYHTFLTWTTVMFYASCFIYLLFLSRTPLFKTSRTARNSLKNSTTQGWVKPKLVTMKNCYLIKNHSWTMINREVRINLYKDFLPMTRAPLHCKMVYHPARDCNTFLKIFWSQTEALVYFTNPMRKKKGLHGLTELNFTATIPTDCHFLMTLWTM